MFINEKNIIKIVWLLLKIEFGFGKYLNLITPPPLLKKIEQNSLNLELQIPVFQSRLEDGVAHQNMLPSL